MTRYTIVWVRSARDELAEFWLNASDRESVAVAANTIDQELVEHRRQRHSLRTRRAVYDLLALRPLIWQKPANAMAAVRNLNLMAPTECLPRRARQSRIGYTRGCPLDQDPDNNPS